MKIIGCDFHPSYQQIAMVDTDTGELWEGRLEHEQGEARRFYHALQGQPVRVGMEAVGNAQWFERMSPKCRYSTYAFLLTTCQPESPIATQADTALEQELWIGDAAQIRQMVVRRAPSSARTRCAGLPRKRRMRPSFSLVAPPM